MSIIRAIWININLMLKKNLKVKHTSLKASAIGTCEISSFTCPASSITALT